MEQQLWGFFLSPEILKTIYSYGGQGCRKISDNNFT